MVKDKKSYVVQILHIVVLGTVLGFIGNAGQVSAQRLGERPGLAESSKGGKNENVKGDKTPEGKVHLIKGEENHRALSVYHRNAMEHSRALYHYAATSAQLNKELIKEHTNEIGRNIEGAKRHHTVLEKVTAAESDLKERHAAIRMHHAMATENYEALKVEVGKQAPEAKIIKEHAAGVYHALKRAESENIAMKGTRKVTEPVEPPANR
jgi:hypothetical protein